MIAPFDRPIPTDHELYTVEMVCCKTTMIVVAAKTPEEAERSVRNGRGVTLTIVEDTIEFKVMDGEGNLVQKGE